MIRWLAFSALLLVAPVAAAAQSLEDYDYEELSFRGASLDIGYAVPDKVEPTRVYTVRVDLGYVGPYVRVMPAFSYWSSGFRDRELTRLATRLGELGADVSAEDLGPIDWRSYALALDGQAAWVTPIGAIPYFGAGVGLNVLDGRGPAVEDTFIEDLLDTVTASVSTGVGLDWIFPAGFRFYGEARYTLMSDVRYWSVHAGGGFVLPWRLSAEEVR
ncbi:MAG TPA: hypothetical protein VNZ57_07590 [Longimicrobiales bacterium]|nr:hypothetical protein [Longimicrobiales bacterium]